VSARFAVHVQPRAKRTGVVGRHGAAVKIAERLCVPRAAVRVVAGAASRDKLVEVDGLSADDARRALLAPPADGRRPTADG
jgi:uncharacterized protein YggU (UPF0235/DUF167 family)